MTDESDVNALTATLAKEGESKPILIVLDTLARCFVGGDENSAQEIGKFVDACRRLQIATGAAVLILHHTGKPKMGRNNKDPLERGSSALRGAADVMISQNRIGDLITISNEKQKDDEGFKPIALRLTPIVVGTDSSNQPVKSCVLLDAKVNSQVSSLSPLNGSEQLALDVLGRLGTASSGEWREAIATAKAPTEVPDKTFQNWRSALVGNGYVEEVPEKQHFYRLTPAGRAIAKQTLKDAA
jgi:hypothetical protein